MNLDNLPSGEAQSLPQSGFALAYLLEQRTPNKNKNCKHFPGDFG